MSEKSMNEQEELVPDEVAAEEGMSQEAYDKHLEAIKSGKIVHVDGRTASSEEQLDWLRDVVNKTADTMDDPFQDVSLEEWSHKLEAEVIRLHELVVETTDERDEALKQLAETVKERDAALTERDEATAALDSYERRTAEQSDYDMEAAADAAAAKVLDPPAANPPGPAVKAAEPAIKAAEPAIKAAEPAIKAAEPAVKAVKTDPAK